MISQRYRLVLLGLILVVLAGGFRILIEQVQLRRPIPPGTEIYSRTTYELCSHVETTKAQLPQKKQLTLSDLRSLYPSQDGWRSELAEKEVDLARTIQELCPTCRKQTHLGCRGNFVAVVRGPAGVDGGVVRVTKIRVADLPSDLRKQAEQGMLNLPDETSLYQILDSLEENTGSY